MHAKELDMPSDDSPLPEALMAYFYTLINETPVSCFCQLMPAKQVLLPTRYLLSYSFWISSSLLSCFSFSSSFSSHWT